MKTLILTITLILAACAPRAGEIIKPPPTEPIPEPIPKLTQVTTKPPQASTTQPILQVDSGGHLAKIWDVTFTPDGRYLVSAAEDKLIRVWDVDTGKTVRTLRGQIGVGREGKIFAMALSPDGRWLAVGGWLPSENVEYDAIRLYDFTSGKLVTLLKGHTNVVHSLAFSPNNRYLVSGSGDNNAIIWDLESKASALGDWDLESKPSDLGDSKQILSGHTDSIYAVAFTPDSQRVVTGSLDHSLRLWRVRDGELITTLKGHTDKVYAVAISPQEDIIASGSDDYTIRLWDGRTGQFIKTLANQGANASSLSFSPDGQYLVSGGSQSSNKHCHVWSIPDGKEIVIYRSHDNVVIATAVSPDGRVVATGGGNNKEIHLWSLRDGKLQQRLGGVGAAIWAVGFSADGRELGWGKTHLQQLNQIGKLEYTITLPSKSEGLDSKFPAKSEGLDSKFPAKSEGLDSKFPAKSEGLDSKFPAKSEGLDSKFLGTPQKLSGSDKGFSRGQNKWRDWTLRTRKGGNYGYQAILDIRQQDRTVASIERGSTDGYDHRSYTFTPDGERIISGGVAGVLTAYNRDGDKLGNFVGHTGDVFAVAVSADGRLLASGSADQTVRLWNVETRENLLTLFHGSDGEWVAWTPTGHYTASPNGDKMVGWQINRGIDKAADYVKAAQLRDHFYRPAIVANTIRLHDVNLAIAQAGGETFRLEQLNTTLPPEFIILEPENPSSTLRKQVEIVLNFKKQPDKIRAYVNNGLMNIKKWAPSLRENDYQKTITLPLRFGSNAIRIVAENQTGTAGQTLQVEVTSRHKDNQGTLYLIAIGVSQYQDANMSLRFAATDARAIHALLTAQAGKRYNKVESRLLADGATTPTAANIRAALQLFNQATPDDTVVLFLSGHGDNSSGRDYYFLSHDAQEQGSNWNPQTVIKWRELQDVLENTIARQRVLLVDTCYSGAAFNPRLINDATANSIVVLSATDGATVGQEQEKLGHGIFTYALLKGLKGKADLIGDDKVVTIKELDTYLEFAIPEVSNGFQVPQSNVQTGFQNFGFVRL